MSDTQKILEMLAETTSKNTEILERLALDGKKGSRRGFNWKSVYDTTGGQTVAPLHGHGGILSVLGAERDVISARVNPMGIAAAVPKFPSTADYPFYPFITGYTAAEGTKPDEVCDDAPTNKMKTCYLSTRWGFVRFDSDVIDFTRVMRRINRGEPMDLVLHGSLLGDMGQLPPGLSQTDVLNYIVMSEMVKTAAAAELDLYQQIYQGTAAANEMVGLDTQISDAIVDAKTDVACPALNSDIKDFAYANIDGSDGRSIVTYLVSMVEYLKHNARRMGLSPVQWVLTMPPTLWVELSEIWPCIYNTGRCGNGLRGQNDNVFLDGRENTAERDAMREGMYIDIGGMRFPVITDDGIHVHTGDDNANLVDGEFASSIYMLPVTIQNGFPVLYMEYLNYQDAVARENIALLRGMQTFWSDRGIYSWAVDIRRWCFQLSLVSHQRMVLRAPQLAGRIQNIKFTSMQYLRDPYPDHPYNLDGGVYNEREDPWEAFDGEDPWEHGR